MIGAAARLSAGNDYAGTAPPHALEHAKRAAPRTMLWAKIRACLLLACCSLGAAPVATARAQPEVPVQRFARLAVQLDDQAELQLTLPWQSGGAPERVEVHLGGPSSEPRLTDGDGAAIAFDYRRPFATVTFERPTAGSGSETAVLRWRAPLEPDGYGWLARRLRFPAPTVARPDEEVILELRSARPVEDLDCEREGDGYECRGLPPKPVRVWVARPPSTVERELWALGGVALLLLALAAWRIWARYRRALDETGVVPAPPPRSTDRPSSYRAPAPIEVGDPPTPRLPSGERRALVGRIVGTFGTAVALTLASAFVFDGRTVIPVVYPVVCCALLTTGLAALLLHSASAWWHWTAWILPTISLAFVWWRGELSGLIYLAAVAPLLLGFWGTMVIARDRNPAIGTSHGGFSCNSPF